MLVFQTVSAAAAAPNTNVSFPSHNYLHQRRVTDLLLGIHCDSKGNVYAGTNDGVHVWNNSGKLLGKIYTGIVAANFQFAGEGRMIIMGKTKLFYATLAASGVALQ